MQIYIQNCYNRDIFVIDSYKNARCVSVELKSQQYIILTTYVINSAHMV